MLGADYVAIDGRMLDYLAGSLPWWIQYLPYLAIIIMIIIWLLLRQRIGAWAVLVGYIIAMVLLVSLATRTVESSVDKVPLNRWLSREEQAQLEITINARVFSRNMNLCFLRDAECRSKIEQWLAGNVH